MFSVNRSAKHNFSMNREVSYVNVSYVKMYDAFTVLWHALDVQARERNAGDFFVACDLVYFAVPGFLIIRKPEAA